MDIKKEISEGKGYAVVEIENMDLLSQLQKSFIKNLVLTTLNLL